VAVVVAVALGLKKAADNGDLDHLDETAKRKVIAPYVMSAGTARAVADVTSVFGCKLLVFPLHICNGEVDLVSTCVQPGSDVPPFVPAARCVHASRRPSRRSRLRRMPPAACLAKRRRRAPGRTIRRATWWTRWPAALPCRCSSGADDCTMQVHCLPACQPRTMGGAFAASKLLAS
jgi:hypothetical protein